MKLATYQNGDPQLPTLLLAHGLFGQARNLGVIARGLEDIRYCVSADMRNHGQSPWSHDHSYGAMAGDLAALIDELPGQSTDLLGHSMGGKAAMVAALQYPKAINRLIVADIAPVAYSHDHHDFIAAMRSLDLDKVSRRSQAIKALSDKGIEPSQAAFLIQNLDIERSMWMVNLDALDNFMADLIGFPEMDASFDGPVLFLAGAHSNYLRPCNHAQIHKLFPNAQIETIEQAGHWLHADQPAEVVNIVRDFLTQS